MKCNSVQSCVFLWYRVLVNTFWRDHTLPVDYRLALLLLLLVVVVLLLLLLFLCRFTALAEAVLNVEIFLLRELQLVAKGQEDAFTLQD